MKKKITTIILSAGLLAGTHLATAQSWNLTGNTNMTSTSKIGGTSATTAQNFPLRLYTYNAERLHINANVSGKVGYVGIGTTSPAQKLHVVGNGYFTGNVGIGIAAPTYKLHVVGAANGIYGSGTTTGVYGEGGTYGISGYSSSGYGIYGYSSTGYGVAGSSGYLGVYGSGTTYGLFGSGGTYGAYASGTDYGVYGYSSTGYGVAGVSGNNYGLYGEGNIGSIAYGAYVGAWGDGDSYGLVGYGGPYGCWATGTSYAGYFSGNVHCTAVYSGSDRSLKKNITEFNSALDIINKLKPRLYEFRNDGNYAQMNLPEGSHYGLIAQDVEQVLPNLVKATEFNAPQKIDKDGKSLETGVAATKSEKIDYLAVNYTELIPIIIKAMQEQEQKISALETENAQMKQDLQSCCLNHSTTPANDKVKTNAKDQPLLEQNNPNPFNEATTIHYYLPVNSTAVLKVMSIEGQEMLSEQITKAGYGEVHISGSTMAAGTYTYTLMVNGKAVESKIMVLTK